MSDPPQLPKGNLNELSVPSAPYPPMHLRTPPRSSLSSSPHYSASYVHRNSDPTSSPSAVRLGSGENNEDADNTGISLAYGELPKSYSEQPKTPRATPVHASQIKILPQWNNVIACINCIQSQPILDPTLLQEPPVIRKRKVGPMLLELRRLELSSINSDQGDGSFFTTRSIAFSRGNPSLGTSVASTCLDLPTVQTYSGTQSSQMPMAAATGLTTGMLAIHSFGNDTDEENLLSSSIEYYHTPRHHRQASAVAWRPNNFNHVVIGLLGSNTAGPQQASGPRRGGQSNRAGGDREFCCFLWDIETQQSSAKRNVSPVSKLSHNAPVASLAWMLDGQTLAIGGQSRNIQLYDMKVSGTNVPPISAYAHNFGVHGIEVCPHRPHLMATFCRAIGEPVKLWDIRRMDSVVSEIKISGLGAGAQASNSSASQIANQRVEAVKWASLEPGTLSVAICDSVQDFDTNSGSRPTLIRVNHHMKGEQTINDFALYGGPSPTRKGYTVGGEDSDQSNRLIEEIYPRRMLAVLEDKTVCDMAKHTYAPVAISRRDGRLVHALGAHVWVGSTTFGPAAMEKNFINEEDDISATMMGRARCLRKARYSMDTASNIKMLSEEIPRGESFTDGLSARFTLLRLWSWIDRVESLCEDAEDIEDDSLWPARGLLDAGIWNLLGMETEGEVDKVLSCPTLGVEFYRNSSRQ